MYSEVWCCTTPMEEHLSWIKQTWHNNVVDSNEVASKWYTRKHTESDRHIETCHHSHVCTHLHTYTATYVHTYTPTHLHSHVCTHLHSCTATYVHTYTAAQPHMYTPTHLHSHVCTHLHSCTHTYLHRYTHIPQWCMNIGVHICECECMYTSMYTGPWKHNTYL